MMPVTTSWSFLTGTTSSRSDTLCSTQSSLSRPVKELFHHCSPLHLSCVPLLTRARQHGYSVVTVSQLPQGSAFWGWSSYSGPLHSGPEQQKRQGCCHSSCKVPQTAFYYQCVTMETNCGCIGEEEGLKEAAVRWWGWWEREFSRG